MHYLSVDTFRWSTWRETYPTPTYPHPPLLPHPPTPTYPHPPLLLPTPTPTLPLPTPTPTTLTHPYSYLPLPTPTPTYPYPYPPQPLPTLTHPYPYPPLPLPTPTHPYHHPPLLQIMVLKEANSVKHGLERSQFINNVKHGLKRSWWGQMLVMYKCGAGAWDWIQTPPALPPPLPPTLESHNYLSNRNSNGSKRITVQMNSHKHTLNSFSLPLININSNFFQTFITGFHFTRFKIRGLYLL